MASSVSSAEFVYMFVPTIMYWVYSGLYGLFGNTKKYRLHPKEDEDTKNIPSKREVVKIVLIQQLVQIAVNLLFFTLIQDGTVMAEPPLLVRLGQFFLAMAIMDTYQYFVHRYLHTNKFLYKHLHSKHHNIVVPYSYAALYTHPIEGFIVDVIGGGLSSQITGMTPLTAVFFFSFSAIKAVDDHCGFMLPAHPFHKLFDNNSAFHDVHHQLYGNKYNFSQPFFITWDKIMGTHMPFSLEKRMDGGLEVTPIIKKKD